MFQTKETLATDVRTAGGNHLWKPVGRAARSSLVQDKEQKTHRRPLLRIGRQVEAKKSMSA